MLGEMFQSGNKHESDQIIFDQFRPVKKFF